MDLGATQRLTHKPTTLIHSLKEVIVARKYVDCREFPSEMNCTIAISADSEEELLEAAVQHAMAVHGHDDSPEFRNQLRGIFKEGTRLLI